MTISWNDDLFKFLKYVWNIPLSPIKIPITLKCSILNFTYDLSIMRSEEVTNKINYIAA